MALLRALRSTWRWWAPPLALLAVLALGVAGWLVLLEDSPIRYSTLGH